MRSSYLKQFVLAVGMLCAVLIPIVLTTEEVGAQLPPGGYRYGFHNNKKDPDNSSTYLFSTGRSTGTAGLPAANINDFVNVIYTRLYGTIEQNRIGAAFIINLMLGNSHPTHFTTTSQGVNKARADFATWETLVRKYNQLGLVEYNKKTTYASKSLNFCWGIHKSRAYNNF